ncbi:MAG: pantoate kinase [Candidatus Heimdallarchaeota archaeon]
MAPTESSTWGVPAHITGIFRVVEHEDLLQMGSLGAGFSIERLITTRIIAKHAPATKTTVFFNNKRINGCVSLAVIKQFQSYLEHFSIRIEHNSELPMQAGFGTSGAGALGTAFALNELFQLEKSPEELGQAAHRAEVECRTGLGDVLAQMVGKGELRVKAGAPGIGKIVFLDWPKDQLVLSVALGPLPTKKIITNPQMIQRINQYSVEALERLKAAPNLPEFLKASYYFAEKTSLMTKRVQALLDTVIKEGFKGSMIMLGQSVFVVGVKEELKRCQNIILKKFPKAKMWLDPLAQKGPRIV